MKTKLMQLADMYAGAMSSRDIISSRAALEAEIDRVCKDAAKPPAVLMNQLVNDKLELSAKLAERDAEIERIMQAITDPENQPSQYGTVLMADMQKVHAELHRTYECIRSHARITFAAEEKVQAQRKVLEEARRELHACQAVIHLHGGFDPAYVVGAQLALKNIDLAIKGEI